LIEQSVQLTVYVLLSFQV